MSKSLHISKTIWKNIWVFVNNFNIFHWQLETPTHPCGSTLLLKIMILTNFNLLYLNWQKICFRWWFLKDLSLYIHMYNCHYPQLWYHPSPGDHDLNKFESSLPENASTHVIAFMPDRFLRRSFKIFLYIIFCICTPSYPRGS